jgi:rare lipoprotein A
MAENLTIFMIELFPLPTGGAVPAAHFDSRPGVHPMIRPRTHAPHPRPDASRARWILTLLFAVLPLLLVQGCGRPSRSPYRDWKKIERATWIDGNRVQEGIVSWYDESTWTAMGTRFDPEQMTAAHKTLPFGTMVRVTRLDNRRSVVVQINDRGPFIEGRVIDLARRPAREMDLLVKGVAPCRVEVVYLPTS